MSSRMHVTVLVENTAGDRADLMPEFGLSLLIETGETTVLLDTGSSGRFSQNARALGIDLEAVDWLVISHGHYDHGGGLAAFCEQNHHAPVILRRGADRPCFGSLVPGLPTVLHRTRLVTRSIGLDPVVLRRWAQRIQWIDGNRELTPGVRVLTTIPDRFGQPRGNRYLLIEQAGRFVPDDFGHELVLAIEHEGGAVVFSGCAHHGILNMMEALRLDGRDDPDHGDHPGPEIRAVVGGFHLSLPRSEKMSASTAEIQDLARALGETVHGPIYTGHCTGAAAFETLKRSLGLQLHALHTGDRFEL